jgi:hypothetical protein
MFQVVPRQIQIWINSICPRLTANIALSRSPGNFTYDGKTTTSAAGQLEVGFARSNDQLTITYSVCETGSTVPTLSNSYVVTIKGNLLVNAAGKETGKIGWLSLLLDDPQWTYKFFKGSDVDDGKKVIKVTAASKQGQTSVVYKGLLKLK